MSALAERYAEAAFRLTKTVELGDRLVSELSAFFQQLRALPALRQVMTDPSLRREASSVLTEVTASAGMSELGQNVLRLLESRGRLNLLEEVGRALCRRVDKAAGRLRAHVQSAVPLSPKQVERLEHVLRERFGKPVVADILVEPRLLAGIVCRVGRLTFDSSVKKQVAYFAERVGA